MPKEVSPEEQRLLNAEQELRDALKKERAGNAGAEEEVKAAQQKVRAAFREYKKARRAATPAGPLSDYEKINEALWLANRERKSEEQHSTGNADQRDRLTVSIPKPDATFLHDLLGAIITEQKLFDVRDSRFEPANMEGDRLSNLHGVTRKLGRELLNRYRSAVDVLAKIFQPRN